MPVADRRSVRTLAYSSDTLNRPTILPTCVKPLVLITCNSGRANGSASAIERSHWLHERIRNIFLTTARDVRHTWDRAVSKRLAT